MKKKIEMLPLGDLQGPKLRIGEVKEIKLKKGEKNYDYYRKMFG